MRFLPTMPLVSVLEQRQTRRLALTVHAKGEYASQAVVGQIVEKTRGGSRNSRGVAHDGNHFEGNMPQQMQTWL